MTMALRCEACEKGWYHFQRDCPAGKGLLAPADPAPAASEPPALRERLEQVAKLYHRHCAYISSASPHAGVTFEDCMEVECVESRAALARARETAPAEPRELTGYELAGCADRAGVIVRREDGTIWAADWDRFSKEVMQWQAGYHCGSCGADLSKHPVSASAHVCNIPAALATAPAANLPSAEAGDKKERI